MRSRPALFVLVIALGSACTGAPSESAPPAGGLVEPEVFDVIRASNSAAALAELRDRYDQEREHARLLQARIDEMAAAEEGLAVEQRERATALQSLRDSLRKLTEEQAALTRELEAMKQQNAALEQAIAAEKAKKDGAAKAE